MKKTLTTFSAALLLTLASCGPTAEEAALGYYELDVEALRQRFIASLNGKDNSMTRLMLKDIDRSSGWIRLQPEGKFGFNMGGAENPNVEGTWTIDEDKLKMVLQGTTQIAKLENDVITIVIDDQPMGTRLYNKKPDPDLAAGKGDKPEDDKPETGGPETVPPEDDKPAKK